MQILNVEPKDIHITIDLSVTESRSIVKALDHSQINYDGKDEPDMVDASGCLSSFYKMLSEVLDGLPKHTPV